jgi:hypothetical protein
MGGLFKGIAFTPFVLWSLRLEGFRHCDLTGSFILPTLADRISPVRSFPAWLLLPFRWKFIAFHGGFPFSGAFKNPQGFGAISTATPFPEILLCTQGGNLFCHSDVDELVESYTFQFRSFAQLLQQRGLQS